MKLLALAILITPALVVLAIAWGYIVEDWIKTATGGRR